MIFFQQISFKTKKTCSSSNSGTFFFQRHRATTGHNQNKNIVPEILELYRLLGGTRDDGTETEPFCPTNDLLLFLFVAFFSSIYTILPIFISTLKPFLPDQPEFLSCIFSKSIKSSQVWSCSFCITSG